MKTHFLECPGEPPIKWSIWYQMFSDHLVAMGLDSVSENRRLALLRTSLGSEGYKICSELCPSDSSFDETVQLLQNRFAPKQSRIYSRAQFNRRVQGSHETCLEFTTALRALAAKCEYRQDFKDELIRDRLVAGCRNDRLRERFLLEPDTLTLEQALTIGEAFERATSESSSVTQCTPSGTVQTLGAKKSFKSAYRNPAIEQSP